MSTHQLPLFSPSPPSPKSYHVRTPIRGNALEAAAEIKAGERKASKQDAALLAYLKATPGPWAPSRVKAGLEARYPWATFLLTSVRRGMTNLTKRGELRMLVKERRPSPAGGMEHLWMLAERNR